MLQMLTYRHLWHAIPFLFFSLFFQKLYPVVYPQTACKISHVDFHDMLDRIIKSYNQSMTIKERILSKFHSHLINNTFHKNTFNFAECNACWIHNFTLIHEIHHAYNKKKIQSFLIL